MLKEIIENRSLILEGIKNSIITKSDVEEIAKERKSICDNCPVKTAHDTGDKCDSHKHGFAEIDFTYTDGSKRKKGNVYSGCGCFLHLKTRSVSASCPLGKWLALTNDEEVNKALKEL